MGKQYRTAQGKLLDMSALVSRNEKTRAVGNMNVNARGDTIDSYGRVILPVTKKVGDKYQKTVANRAAKITRRKDEITRPIETAPKPETKVDLIIDDEPVELTAEELEFEEFLSEEEIEIEAAKAKESAKK